MVTLKNNFGVEPDKDSVVMNVSEGSPNDAKSTASGHPKAILVCRRNSHPFQARTLILNTPAKIGRSVARVRPSSCNGIFDCKVLSRNHAIIWYEYDTGKFMIQDTKSSNGTFVNSQRLSKGGETSLPREFFSRDVIQFGVDVLENQRKGNEESDNSDESNLIVTHGCIVAIVRLFHPNGKESKFGQPYATPNPMTPIPQEKICKLELIIHEAQQREGRLHDKLEELQVFIGKLEASCQETLTNRFEETRLLSKIANLEKQTKVMSKMMGGSGKSSEKVEAEIRQLLVEIEKVQTVAREIQERQHRKLLESEQKVVEAQRVAANLEIEVLALREQASLTELHLQEMGAKCTAYCQTIDLLKSNYHAQLELTQKLEARMTKIDDNSDRDLKTNFSELNMHERYKYIGDEADDEALKKDKENQEVILEQLKNIEDLDKIEEKDFLNEQDKSEWLIVKSNKIIDAMCVGFENLSNCIGQLEGALMDVEMSKKKLEKLCIRSHALSLELEAAKLPTDELEKTENDYEGELYKTVNLPTVSNKRITELEMELEENEELLNQARFKQRECEGKYTKLRFELDATVKRFEKMMSQFCTLKVLTHNYLKSDELRHRIECKDIKIENAEQKLLEVIEDKSTDVKETQTPATTLVTTSTNTDANMFKEKIKKKNVETDEVDSNNKCNELNGSRVRSESVSPSKENDNSKNEILNLGSMPSIEPKQEKLISSLSLESKVRDEDNHPRIRMSEANLGAWGKIQKIQSVLNNHISNNSSPPSCQINEMQNLMNLLTEDFVHLLLREQQISKDKQNLEEKLNNSKFPDGATELGVPMQIRTMLVVSLTAIAVYFLYIILL